MRASSKLVLGAAALCGATLALAAGADLGQARDAARVTVQQTRLTRRPAGWDGSIVLQGKDISIEGSGKVNVKSAGDVVLKGSKILQN